MSGSNRAESVLKVALLADASSVNIELWCEGLSHAGVDIHVLSFSGSVPKATQNYRLPIPRLPGKVHYLAAVPYVRWLLKTIKPDIVVGYYITGYGTLARLAGYHPVVQVTAGTDVLLAPENALLNHLVRRNLCQADLVLALAPHMAEAALLLGAAEKQILVLPHGVPLQRFTNQQFSGPFNDDLPRIISTRSLHPAYKHHVMLTAMRLLQQSQNRMSALTLAGDGPQRQELVTLAQEMGLERNVQFVGFVPNDQLPTLLARHNLYVSLIQWDGVSASLLEAMAVGLVPIVPDNAANRFWITPGENGLLLHDDSPLTVANVISQAMSDRSLRKRAWQQNPKIVRNRGDLYKNSNMLVQHLRRFVNNTGTEQKLR